jgi:purine-binding chemotaxis protein CheW
MQSTLPTREQDTGQAGGGQHLTFALGEQEYGIELLRVQEIKGYTAITPIPRTPPHIKGVINLRGAVVPVMDLRAKFAMEPVEYNKFTVIVLVTIADKVLGVVVDAVKDVLTLNEGQIQPPPDLGERTDARFLQGLAAVGDKLIAMLDIDTLFAGDVASLQTC